MTKIFGLIITLVVLFGGVYVSERYEEVYERYEKAMNGLQKIKNKEK